MQKSLLQRLFQPLAQIARRGWLLPLGMVLSVHAVPPGFHLGEDAAGPSCAYFTGMGHMAWTRRGGDWMDRAGVLHGAKAFDVRQVPTAKGRTTVHWDVSDLVRGWVSRQYPNEGFMLRAEPATANGIVSFLSHEDPDASGRPLLDLKWSDGTTTRLSAQSDTYLDCSTYSSLGMLKEFKVGAAQSALLRFELPARDAGLDHAELVLATDRQYGSSTTVGVYRAAPPYARASAEVSMGLAAAYPHDAGISKHPDVLFANGFESALWLVEWGDYSPRSNAEAISEDPGNRFEPLSGRALRVRIPKGANLGLDLRHSLGQTGSPEPEEVYFRYYVRFGDDWNPYVDGGKLPGIAGTYGRAGWGMRKTDGYNGWSVRGSFAARSPNARSVTGMTSLGSYAYHADIEDSSGEYWGWSEGPSALLQNNRWYAVEQYVKLNTPGQKDGVFRAWIDGQRVFERTNVRFRHSAELKVETIWLNVYHGGVSAAPKDLTMYIDNVVVAKSYIGPFRR